MSPDNFDIAMAFVAQHEGGFSDDPADKGGATKYGISLRFLQLVGEDIDGDGHVTAADIRVLTTRDAKALYREHFWLHYRLDEIEHPFLAAKAMDLFVNMRGKTAARCLQRACGATADGLLGSQSIKAVNTYGKVGLLYSRISNRQAALYQRIVDADETQRRFLRGWLRRASR